MAYGWAFFLLGFKFFCLGVEVFHEGVEFVEQFCGIDAECEEVFVLGVGFVITNSDIIDEF